MQGITNKVYKLMGDLAAVFPMTGLNDLILIAADMHHPQKRKFSDDPYIVHPLRVAFEAAKNQCDVAMVKAALFHDVVEDTDTTVAQLIPIIGIDAALLVEHLTDQYDKESFPDWNRDTRKRAEDDRLAHIPLRARVIKALDILDNHEDIREGDPDFFKVWRYEKDRSIKTLFDTQYWPIQFYPYIRRDLWNILED